MNGLQKFYIGLWTVFALVVIGLAIAGSLTMMAVTVLGFVTFGLIFMGMMCVLPTTVGQVHAVPHVKATTAAKPLPERSSAITSWLSPVGIEMRPANHRR